jgi:pimeloyl-ACP methyl ester carboxylesterase
MRRSLTRHLMAIAFTLGWTAAVAAEQPARPSSPVETHVLTDGQGRHITYYLSHPATLAPLLLMIQGSGCALVMNGGPGNTYSTLYDFLPLAAEGRFAVMAIEKPFAGVASGGNNDGTARSCSAAFNADFTAESWLAAIQAALADARKKPWVDKTRTLVLGMSEGAVMADLLAGRDSRVTDVISIGGSGTTQLFDMIALDYRQCFDVPVCLADTESKARAIAADPSSATAFAWGHPYKRWSSFFRVDPADELLRSKARVYLAFGTRDASVPPLSGEIIAAKLLATGRDVTVRRVPDAGHDLVRSESSDWDELDHELRAALVWFWARKN